MSCADGECVSSLGVVSCQGLRGFGEEQHSGQRRSPDLQTWLLLEPRRSSGRAPDLDFKRCKGRQESVGSSGGPGVPVEVVFLLQSRSHDSAFQV